MYRWVIILWFELGTLFLLCLNLWFVFTVLETLRETNRWLVFLSRIQWDETHRPDRILAPGDQSSAADIDVIQNASSVGGRSQ